MYNRYPMEKKRFFTTKMIAVTGVLTGIEIVLQVIGNYIQPGFANINLSLIPICLGAILYGPLVGGFLGLICGVMILVAPSTGGFFAISPIGTILACLIKTTLAGVIAGYVMKLCKNKTFLGSILVSIIVPVVNTGVFAIFTAIFFRSALEGMVAQGLFADTATALFLGMIGINFILEIVSTLILTPSLFKIIEHQSTRVE